MENSNENQLQEQFYKYRGVTKCLSAGISFLTDNFKHIVRLSLPVAVLLSVLCASVFYVLSDSRLQQVLLSGSQFSGRQMASMLLLIPVMILIYAVVFLFNGLIYREVKIYSHGIPLKRFPMIPTYKIAAKYGLKIFCLAVVVFAIGFVCGFASVTPMLINTEGQVFLYLRIAITIILFVSIIVLAIPFNLSIPAMFLNKGKALKLAWRGYRQGLKIWGKVFCLSLLISLLGAFIMFVLVMPAIVMVSCYQSATLSQLYGDAATLPAGFHLLYFIVLVLSVYLMTFTTWVQIASFCYLYAAVKCDEKEEKKNDYLKKFN